MVEEEEPVKKSGINKQLVTILILAVLLVIFTLQNQEKVSLKLFFWSVKNIPVALLIIICLLLGYLIPYLLLLGRIWKLKSELVKTRKEKEELQTAGQEREVTKRKHDPEGLEFDDNEDDPHNVDLARKNFSGRFFKE